MFIAQLLNQFVADSPSTVTTPQEMPSNQEKKVAGEQTPEQETPEMSANPLSTPLFVDCTQSQEDLANLDDERAMMMRNSSTNSEDSDREKKEDEKRKAEDDAALDNEIVSYKKEVVTETAKCEAMLLHAISIGEYVEKELADRRAFLESADMELKRRVGDRPCALKRFFRWIVKVFRCSIETVDDDEGFDDFKKQEKSPILPIEDNKNSLLSIYNEECKYESIDADYIQKYLKAKTLTAPSNLVIVEGATEVLYHGRQADYHRAMMTLTPLRNALDSLMKVIDYEFADQVKLEKSVNYKMRKLGYPAYCQ